MNDRRLFLHSAATLGLATLAPHLARADDKKEKPAEEVGATEDLMREHGVLNRALLIYEEGLQHIRAKKELPPEVFQKTATLIRKFVEEYHEKLEENFIFPEFKKKNKHMDLVAVLLKQHEAGRKLTEVILRESAPDRFRKEESRKEVAAHVEAFVRMYRPHEAREDTVLFPALHEVLSPKRIKELGEQFEKEEDRLFGEEGFEKTVEQVAGIEKQLGIYDLDQFTPKTEQR
ncbi:MAG: hemerythrin domain-containing protein [Gemmataceae bacterium]